MTPKEIAIAKRLRICTFLPGSYDKRFIRNMAFRAEHSPEKELTPKQHELLVVTMRHRYRRQLGEAP